jgi:hypothetical protein
MRFVTVVFLAGLLAVGPVAAQESSAPADGAAATEATTTKRKVHKKPAHTPATRLTAQMERDLALSSEQLASVQALNEKSLTALDALRPTEEEIKASRRQQRQILSDRDKELKALLSEQQYASLVENREKYEKRMRNMQSSGSP